MSKVPEAVGDWMATAEWERWAPKAESPLYPTRLSHVSTATCMFSGRLVALAEILERGSEG